MKNISNDIKEHPRRHPGGDGRHPEIGHPVSHYERGRVEPNRYRQTPIYLYDGGNYYISPLFVEYPVILQNTPSTSVSSESMQNIDSSAKISFPTSWEYKPEPTKCSDILISYNKSDMNADSSCFCPVGNKTEVIIDNQTMYKCQIPYPNNN
jgi:hypothetical protein